MGIGAGLLAVAGKAGEGAFMGMKEGTLLKAKTAEEDRKSAALAAREKSLAAQQSKYRKEENIQQSALTGSREKEQRTWQSGENIKGNAIKMREIEALGQKRRSDKELDVIEVARKMVEDNLDVPGANEMLRRNGIIDIKYNAGGHLVPADRGAAETTSESTAASTPAASLDGYLNRLTEGSNKPSDNRSPGLLQVDEMGTQATKLNPQIPESEYIK